MIRKTHRPTLKNKQSQPCCHEERPDYSRVKPPERWTRKEALAVAKALRLKANEAEKKVAENVLGNLLRYSEQKDCSTEIREMLNVARRRLEVEAPVDADSDAEEDFDEILDGDGTRVQYETDHFIIDYTVDAGTADQVQDPASDTAVDVALQDGTIIGTTTAGIGVPDFVKMLGIWLEYYLQQYVAYGFNDPTSDGMGGIVKLDITITAGASGTSPGGPINIQDILGSGVGLAGFYNDQGNGLGVTPGHELFHQVQYTYNAGGAQFLRIYKEGTARWAEDSVNDAYNRYNMETPDYLNDTTVSLISVDWRYETVILWKYLSEQKGATLTEPQRGVDAILLLWQNLTGAAVDADGITAIDTTVQALDATSSVYDLFARFAVAVYLKDLGSPYVDPTYDFLEDEEPRIPGGQVYGAAVPFDEQDLTGLSPDYVDAGTSVAWGLQYYIFNLDASVQSVNVSITADAAFTTPFYRVLEIRSGSATVHEGAGAAYTVDLLTDITDPVTARIDQAVVIVGAYETGGDYTLTVSLNSCVPSVMLVIDHSGSMASQSKMTNAIDAATLFVDVAEANGVPGLGAVGFSTTAAVLPNSSLIELTGAHATDVRNSLSALVPTSMTSIGGGLEMAWGEFDGDPIAANREVIVLLTDGIENTAPMIDDVDDTLLANNVRVYPIGLGEDTGIEPEKLEDLAVFTGGDYRMTADPTVLEEFYLQILADNLCGDMDGSGSSDGDSDFAATDADTGAPAAHGALIRENMMTANFTVGGGKKIHVVSSDTRLNVILTWQSGQTDDADLIVIGPDRLVITSSNYRDIGGIRYRRGRNYAFFTIDLPVDTRKQGTWYGYPVNVASGGGVIRAFMLSGMGLTAGTSEPVLYTGHPITFTCRVTEGGRPVSGLTLTVNSDQPLYSYGNVMTEDIKYPSGSTVKGDSVPDAKAKLSALIAQHGPDLVPRQTETFVLKELSGAPGTYVNSLLYPTNPGSYHFTVKAAGKSLDGDHCVRYTTFTKVVRVELDSQSTTFTLAAIPQAANQYTLSFAPADKLGNIMGPGYASLISVNVKGGRALGSVQDLNNGTYTVKIFVDPAQVNTAAISIGVKHQAIGVPKQTLIAAVSPSVTPTAPAPSKFYVWLAILALIVAIIALLIVIFS